jgi:hypothetical protein
MRRAIFSEFNSVVIYNHFPLVHPALIYSPGSRYPLEPPLLYLTTSADNFPAEMCLRLTGRLLKEAQIHAQNETPAVYSVADLLMNHQVEIVELLRGEWHFVHIQANRIP